MKHVVERLQEYSIVFFDFDGVIKDSVYCKGIAFRSLFSNYDEATMKRIEAHHNDNPGVPRSEKIATYLTWVGERNTPAAIKNYCNQFATIATLATINAPWVPGVQTYLQRNYKKQKLILVSAIPNEELIYIISEISIKSYFFKVYGFPMRKENAIRKALHEDNCDNRDAVFIGDALADYKAANACSVEFVYRGQKMMHTPSELSNCDSINDFIIS